LPISGEVLSIDYGMPFHPAAGAPTPIAINNTPTDVIDIRTAREMAAIFLVGLMREPGRLASRLRSLIRILVMVPDTLVQSWIDSDDGSICEKLEIAARPVAPCERL
jgi:hypothetical protein